MKVKDLIKGLQGYDSEQKVLVEGEGAAFVSEIVAITELKPWGGGRHVVLWTTKKEDQDSAPIE